MFYFAISLSILIPLIIGLVRFRDLKPEYLPFFDPGSWSDHRNCELYFNQQISLFQCHTNEPLCIGRVDIVGLSISNLGYTEKKQ